MNTPWSPASWRSKSFPQEVEYPDPAALDDALQALSKLPPLVTSWEVEALRSQLASACRGEAFLLQGGDCSETFADCRSEPIEQAMEMALLIARRMNRTRQAGR